MVRIARIKTRSWVCTCVIGAQHYYGAIEYWDRTEGSLATVPSVSRLSKINRDRRERHDLYLGERHKPGEPSDQFYSLDELYREAAAFFSDESNRRGCDLVIVDGDHLNPGFVVWSYDEDLLAKANAIYAQYASTDDDDDDVEDELRDQWKALIREDERPERDSFTRFDEGDDEEEDCRELESLEDEESDVLSNEDIHDIDQATIRSQSGPASRFIKPSQLPATAAKLDVPVHVQSISGTPLSNAETETFYMCSADVTGDDGEPIGAMFYGLDLRIAVVRGESRLVITGPELWNALQPLFDEVELNQETYLESTKEYRKEIDA